MFCKGEKLENKIKSQIKLKLKELSTLSDFDDNKNFEKTKVAFPINKEGLPVFNIEIEAAEHPQQKESIFITIKLNIENKEINVSQIIKTENKQEILKFICSNSAVIDIYECINKMIATLKNRELL